MNFGQLVLHGQVELLHRVALHVRAFVAGAGVVGGRGVELLAGAIFLHLVDDTGLGGDDVLLVTTLPREAQEAGSRANVIGYIQNVGFTLGVGDESRLRVLHLQLDDLLVAEDFVDHAGAVPEHHVAAGFLHEPTAEVYVWRKDQLLLRRKGVDDVLGVGAGAADIGEGFQLRRAVDVAYDFMVGVLLLELAEDRGRAAVRQRATRLQVGEQHFFRGAQHFGGLGHEVNTGEDDDVGIGLGGLLAQAQAVADVIGDVLDLRFLVIMRQDDGVLLFLELIDLRYEVERRVHIEVEVAHFLQVLGGEVEFGGHEF